MQSELNPNDAIALQDKIWNEPEFFHREVLGYEPWEKQLEISCSIRDYRNTAVRSCNGAGKTFHVSREALRFLFSFSDSVVINTAPTWTQVENQFWRYFREAYHSALIPLGGKLLKTELSIADTWFGKGIANNPDNVASFQGWHAPNIMMIFDEASGISPKIYEAAIGAMSGGAMVRFVIIGNHQLQYLRYFYGLEVEATAHDAFGDILVLEQVLWKLYREVAAKDFPATLPSDPVMDGIIMHMVKISAAPSLLTHIRFGKMKDKPEEEQLITNIAKKDRGYLEWLLEQKKAKPEGEEDWIYTLEHYLK